MTATQPSRFLSSLATRTRNVIRPFRFAVLCLLFVPHYAFAQVAGKIEVYPTTSSLEVTSTRQFTAYVPISPNTIQWLVNGVSGGNSAIGTISTTGFYTPPKTIPANNVLTISARSTAYPTSVGNATLTLTRPVPSLWSVSPSSFPVGQYSVSFNGANFASDSQALANGAPVTTTYVSATKLLVSGSAAAPGSMKFAVNQPGAGSVTSSSVTVNVVAANIAVGVAPSSASVVLGTSIPFTSTVTGTTNTAVTWSVNGIVGGSSTVGTISASGVYVAPLAIPGSPVTVRATSVANPLRSAQAAVTLVSPVKVTMTPTSVTVPVGQNQAFTAAVTGTANTAVTWSVNGTAGGTVALGTISSAGLYAAPTTMPSSSAITIRATSAADGAAWAQASVTLVGPPPAAANLTAARFLEQASFGPTPATLARVQQIGIDAYLDEQFAMPETPIVGPADNSMGALRSSTLSTYTTAPDQLRQRVAYALSQIIVTSSNKLVYADEMVQWLRLLNQYAFGNYRDLLHDVTISPSMGKYLDLARSAKPGISGGANENYPRELMQLFSIGLVRLNQDGSFTLGGNGQPIASYDQNTVRQVALALTGWVYQNNAWEDFSGPMVPSAANHDTSAKSFLNCSLPSNQSVAQDLDGVIDCLMHHPNMPPFIATRLIRSLVTSNPSPQYVKRVADVFAGVQTGVTGDLKATVRAILTDPEARQDTPTSSTFGRLKEPILQISNLVRALNGAIAPTNGLVYLYDYLGQAVLQPPSVFSWFSPLYHVPNSPLFGPEFQIYSPSEAVLRGNFFYSVLTSQNGPDISIDLSPFVPYGNDMPNLVEAANQVLLAGRMPSGLKQVIASAAAPGYDATTRITTVLYLTALSGQFAVQF